MGQELRFDPPALRVSSDLQWVLNRAFRCDRTTRCVNPERALAIAQRLDLGARVASRHALDHLASELGDGPARELAFERLSAMAAHRVVVAGQRRVLAAAESLDIPVVLLKYAALHARGVITEGGRGVRDLDVLVPRPRAKALWDALREDGFSSSGPTAPLHHLPPLLSISGEVVEIHVALPGVTRIPGALGIDAEAAIAAGLVVEIESDGRVCLAPSDDLLLAHVLVHGYVQHGGSPLDYPLMRMIADVADIVGDRDLTELSQRIHVWTARTMERSELDAALRLPLALASGAVDLESTEGLLLRHVVAAACDGDYRRALPLRRLESLALPGQWTRLVRGAFERRAARAEESPAARSSPAQLFRRFASLAGAVAAAAKLRWRSRPLTV